MFPGRQIVYEVQWQCVVPGGKKDSDLSTYDLPHWHRVSAPKDTA